MKSLQFTDAARARFVAFLDQAYGKDRYVLSACESECVAVCEERFNNDESMSWEVRSTESKDRQTHAFSADESDFTMTDQDMIA